MEINITIKDEEGAALAKVLGVSSYKDGNELLLKCVAAAWMRVRQRGLISAVALTRSVEVVDATIRAFEAAVGVALPAAEPVEAVKAS